jgi:Glycosyl transferase family 2
VGANAAVVADLHVRNPRRRRTHRYPARVLELSALRIVGLAIGVALLAFAVWRRRTLRNGDVLLLLVAGVGLLVVSGTDLLDSLLSAFSFQRGNGGRILGLAVFAVIVLFLLAVRSLVQNGRIERKLSAALEGIAWDEFRNAGLTERFRDRVAVVVPAYNEEDNIGQVLPRIPATVCGMEIAVLVVDDGSRDDTGAIAREFGAAVARHATNLGGGAALRTGYRLMVDSGARIVVTLDADGQHRPEEMERLVGPVADGTVDVAHGSRVLGHAEANTMAREMGIIFFNRLVSLITRTRVSDCSNGYRAVRATVLPLLALRQEQFHTSEFMIEAIKRGVPATEVPVTVDRRIHGHSKKPAVLRYGLGFTNAIMRTWLR